MGDETKRDEVPGEDELCPMEYASFLEEFVRQYVDDQGAVRITEEFDPQSNVLRLRIGCAESDMGSVIGCRGIRINTMRTALREAGHKDNRLKISVEIDGDRKPCSRRRRLRQRDDKGPNREQG